jgi:hypothetical protein
MDCSVNGPQKLNNGAKKSVWFEGNGSTAQTVYEGQGVCYNFDYGTAASADGHRYNRVEVPSSGNKTHFAGVLLSGATIPAGGSVVEIATPTGQTVCNVLLAIGESTTIGATRVECTYTAGTWKAASNTGQGTAIALQTITGGAAVQLCQAVLCEGLPATGLAD